jgi:hypothetical protein
MPLSRDDFIRMTVGAHVAIPAEVFGPPPERDASWPDRPDVRRAVEWLKGFLGCEWQARRDTAFGRLYGSAFGLQDQSGKVLHAAGLRGRSVPAIEARQHSKARVASPPSLQP